MTRKLLQERCLFIGISAGANISGWTGKVATFITALGLGQEW